MEDSYNRKTYADKETDDQQENMNKELLLMLREINKKLDSIKWQLDFNTERQKYLNAFFGSELLKLQQVSGEGILLCGNYGNPNTGDEWMLETMISYIRKYTTKEITIMLEPNRNFDTGKYLKYGVKYIHYPQTIYDYDLIVDKFDILIFGGGAIIEDSVYYDAYDFGVNICRTVVDLPLRFIQKHKKVLCLGLSTSTEITNVDYVNKLQIVIKQADFFSVRDRYSLGTLRQAGIDTKQVKLLPDIVFANEELYKAVKETEIPTENRDRDVVHIGIVYIVADETKNGFVNMLNKVKSEILAEGKQYQIMLIPFFDDWHIDYQFYKEVSRDDQNIKVLPYCSDIQFMIEIFKKQDIVVCARYHAILLAMCLGVPCVALYYDTHRHYYNKIAYLMEQFGMSIHQCIQMSRLSDVCDGFMAHKLMNKQYSAEITKKAEEQLSEVLYDNV